LISIAVDAGAEGLLQLLRVLAVSLERVGERQPVPGLDIALAEADGAPVLRGGLVVLPHQQVEVAAELDDFLGPLLLELAQAVELAERPLDGLLLLSREPRERLSEVAVPVVLEARPETGIEVARDEGQEPLGLGFVLRDRLAEQVLPGQAGRSKYCSPIFSRPRLGSPGRAARGPLGRGPCRDRPARRRRALAGGA
jgi:hypothetical protein